MVFLLEEDLGLSVYLDKAVVAFEVEAIDVEAGIYRFFDASGLPLEPRFVNTPRRFLGVRVSQDGGAWVLEPHQGAPDLQSLVSTIAYLSPNPYFDSLEAVAVHLRASVRGA